LDTERRGDLTAILNEARSGGADARERLVRAIYAELRRTAGKLMRRERPGHFGAAAQAMRQVLVDHARRRSARKRGGNRVRVPLDQVLAGFDEQGLDVIALHEALERLAQEHPRPAQVVDLRFFGGLSVPEVAEALAVSDTTIESDWRFARAWLKGRLGGTPA
jgi:RNA polymerase sigma factor (sigma-70 family)